MNGQSQGSVESWPGPGPKRSRTITHESGTVVRGQPETAGNSHRLIQENIEKYFYQD